jgi:hypothetical protein
LDLIFLFFPSPKSQLFVKLLESLDNEQVKQKVQRSYRDVIAKLGNQVKEAKPTQNELIALLQFFLKSDWLFV